MVARVFGKWKRRRYARKVQPGDGSELKRFRWWQLLSRSLLHIRLADPDGQHNTWSVSVSLWGESDGESRAHLYRDGWHHARSTLPAMFEIPGGTIEVAQSTYGLKRCHFIPDNGGATRQLAADPSSAEGRRARLQRHHPGTSRVIGVTSFLILVAALLLGLPQLVEQVSQIPWVAQNIGSFTSPIHLAAWFNTSLVIATVLASTERALRLKYHWLLDGGVFDGEI